MIFFNRRNFADSITFFLIFTSILFNLIFISHFSYETLYWDQWTEYRDYKTLSFFHFLIHPTNEHIIFFPRLIQSIDYFFIEFTNGILLSFIVNNILIFFIAVLISKLLCNSQRFFTFFIYTLLTIPNHYQNILWGFQLPTYLVYFIAIFYIYSINHRLSFLLIPFAIFSQAHGFLLFGIKAINQKFLSKKFFLNFIIFLSVFILLLVFSNHNHAKPIDSLMLHFFKVFEYSFTFLGNFPSILISDVFPRTYLPQQKIAFFFGLIFSIPLMRKSFLYFKSQYIFSRIDLLLVFIFSTSILVGAGRITFGVNQSLDSRYLIISFLYYLPYLNYCYGKSKLISTIFVTIVTFLSFYKIDNTYINNINRSQLEYKYENGRFFSNIWNIWDENLRFKVSSKKDLPFINKYPLDIKLCNGFIDNVYKVGSGYYFEGWVDSFQSISNGDSVPIIRTDLFNISLLSPVFSGFYAYSKNDFLLFDSRTGLCLLTVKK